MKFRITVKPNARKNEVIPTEDGGFIVRVAAPPIEGRANEMLVEALAEHFQTSKRSISILSGFNSKYKIIEFVR